MFDSIVARAIGNEAKLTQNERILIEPPLQRILARLPKETQAKIGNLADPIMLLFGLGLWMMRVSAIQRAKAQVKQEQQQEQRTTGWQADSNGTVPNNPPAENRPQNAAPLNVMPFPVVPDRDSGLLEDI